VLRKGGTMGTVSVHYSTSPGTAQSPDDYTDVSNTLTFAPGESNKTFAVTINADAVAETNEDLYLTLTEPTGGATLGDGAYSVLTIFENGVPSGPNAADYIVAKGQQFIQPGPEAPLPNPEEGPFGFHASVDAKFPGALTSGAVRAPSGTSYPF